MRRATTVNIARRENGRRFSGGATSGSTARKGRTRFNNLKVIAADANPLVGQTALQERRTAEERS